MVATVLGIRLRTALHLMRRDWWRAVLIGFGVLWALVFIPSLLWIQSALARQPADVRADAAVVIAVIAGLGWVLVPLLVSGLDDTLDPARFRSVGADARRIMPGLTAAALLTLPVLYFALAFGLIGFSWRPDGSAAVLVALLGMGLTLVGLVFGARVAALWGTRVLASRRAKAATAAAMLLGLGALVPLAYLLFSQGLSTVLETDFDLLLSQLALTPLGAGAAAPLAAADGDWWGAGWRLALQALWAVVLHAAWRANVARSLVVPLARGGGSRRRDDQVLDARPGFAVPADGPAAAVHARLRRAWLSDPRYLASLAGVLLLPSAFFVLVVPVFDLDPRWSYAVALLLAATVGWGRHNDVAFDSTALWLDVVSGRLGRAVMRGRISATAAWALPVVIAVALATLVWTRSWQDAPGLIGAAVGVLGVSLGVAAVSSVLVPYRAPAPGQNPFGAETGTVGAGFVAQLASSAVAIGLLPLVVIPFVLSLTVSPLWGWLACALGIAIGVGAYVGGVRLGGIVYDRRSGRLLAAVA
ncbi:hypothetical protein [Demequina sp.]|uniref:hypothetical protein n=1 Tax=Demequina sp. TaxID=2050685 RepID=UPI0025EADA6D|nr:hypothetical protein [Demequina sp.]